jgi:dTDP-4-amino-4,6-dideoxygalactose transaminase
VQTSIHYPPIHQFQIYAREGFVLTATEEYARRAITLPLFPHMTVAQADLVVDALREACT